MSNNLPSTTRPTSASELLTQLTTGPTLREVAANTLRKALMELYPTLEIDPDLATVVTPGWRFANNHPLPAGFFTESLTSALTRLALSADEVIYLDGEHFLTLQPQAQPPVHLPVKIDAIARLLNELAPLLFIAFQEQQLDYWNAPNKGTGPRWQDFSSALRKVWNITTLEGWSEHECAMGKSLFHFPDKATRATRDSYNSRAYLVDLDTKEDGQASHASLSDLTVLIGEHEQRPMILVYSLIGGYERYDSLAELGATLPARMVQTHLEASFHWRLYEPGGNFFDSLACTLIGLQIAAIGALGEPGPMRDDQVETVDARPSVARILPSIEDLSDHALSNIRLIHQHIPDWLMTASDLEMSAYSRYLIDLAQLQAHHQGQSFQDDITPLREYARARLQTEILAHPQGENLNLDKVEIIIESPVIWGTFVLPGSVDITRRGLIDLALENLTGLPTGQPSVLYDAAPAPDWLTYSYLKGIIEKLDIGAVYPALVKQKLIDDPDQSQARQLLYTAHLRLQLPLLALQMKIQQNDGIDETGYRYLAAAMRSQAHERQVDSQEIVIRRLAFIPTLRRGKSQDVVANMFVIGPLDHTAGPCLLYRPLLLPVMIQFPSQQNLLYAIKHDRALRDAVLAWLPEEVRFNYAQFVFPDRFPSPWAAVRVLVEPATVVYMSGPITVTDEVLGNDALATLYEDNANALVELATRQSVSNQQKRWETLRHAGWQLFNAALPFFGRTLGIAAWIWQIMDDLREAGQALNQSDEQPQWTAEVDLLLNLGMALALHVSMRSPPPEVVAQVRKLEAEPPRTDLPEAPVVPPKAVIVLQQPTLPGVEPPSHHQGPLHMSGALSRNGLAATLERFKVRKPADLGEQSKTPGPYLNLYPHAEKWLAVVGGQWFEVSVDVNENVVIVDPKDPAHTGPLLISSQGGQWFVDTRLRLRGGGFRNRRRANAAGKPARISTLRAALDEFDATERSRQNQLYQAHLAIGDEPGPSTELRRQQFVSQVDSRLAEYEVPIRQLRSLGIIDTVPNYQSRMIGYLNKQVLLARSAVEARLPSYRNVLASTLDEAQTLEMLEPAKQTATAQSVTALNQDMIGRLEYVESRLKELRKLGMEGTKIVNATVQAMPRLKLQDMKAFQVSLGRYLCIAAGEGEAFTEARAQLHDILDNADIHVQSLMETAPKSNGSPLEEHIEVLNSLVDQFAIVDQRLLDLHAQFPEQLMREPLERVRQDIDEFNQRAVVDLARLIRERKALQPQPGPSRPSGTPIRKVIKTRFSGVVVGETRQAESELVDVRAPMTGKVIATFHEKTPGVWVERARPTSPVQAAPSVDLDTSLSAARTLLDAEPANTQRLLAHSRRPGRIPVEIEEMFHQYAQRLERAQGTIEDALTRLNLTEVDRPAAATLSLELNTATQRLYEEGRSTRITMIKQQLPTAERVQWLRDQGQVTTARILVRKRLKGPGKNYLDEWEVRDRTNQAVLWYAHFHYSSVEAGEEEFFAGHLKTLEQRRQGGAFQQGATNDRDQIAIYRSEISLALARSVFFTR